MNCQDFENQIQDLLDQRVELKSNKSIVCHASVCDGCARKLELYHDLFAASDSDEYSVELSQADYEELSISNASSRVQRLSGVLAACVALALVVWLSFISNENSSRGVANYGRPHAGALDFQHRFDNGALALTQPSVPESKSHPFPGIEIAESEEPLREFGSDLSIGGLPQFGSPAKIAAKKYASSEALENVLNNLSQITPTANQIRRPMESLQSYYRYTSELPGVKPWASGINEAARMIQRSIEDKPSSTQDGKSENLGQHFDAIDWMLRTRA